MAELKKRKEKKIKTKAKKIETKKKKMRSKLKIIKSKKERNKTRKKQIKHKKYKRSLKKTSLWLSLKSKLKNINSNKKKDKSEKDKTELSENKKDKEQKKEDKIQIREQREPIKKAVEKASHPQKPKENKWIKVGIPGFDRLLEKGIPKGTATLLCGGPGSGKTIFGLQTLNYGALQGEKCLYMTFEESEERLRGHMHDFGWNPEKLEKEGKLMIKRYDPFAITRQVEALLEKAKGELLIDVKPVLFPENFKPDRIVLDSLSAIAAAFVGKEDTYRVYIEQLFRLFEELEATSFLVTESTEIPVKLTASGVEEFLADGVIVLYNIQRGNVRENAIEVLKLRGAKHQKKIVAMQIVSGKGVEVYPEQEVYGLPEKE